MRLMPRDEKFFDLFTSVAAFTVDAARLQQDLLRADGALQRRGECQRISRIGVKRGVTRNFRQRGFR